MTSSCSAQSHTWRWSIHGVSFISLPYHCAIMNWIARPKRNILIVSPSWLWCEITHRCGRLSCQSVGLLRQYKTDNFFTSITRCHEIWKRTLDNFPHIPLTCVCLFHSCNAGQKAFYLLSAAAVCPNSWTVNLICLIVSRFSCINSLLNWRWQVRSTCWTFHCNFKGVAKN